MRNTEAEERFIRRLFQFAGAGFLLGVIAIAIGTELLVLSLFAEKPAEFWCWQGLWVMIVSFIIAKLAELLKKV